MWVENYAGDDVFNMDRAYSVNIMGTGESRIGPPFYVTAWYDGGDNALEKYETRDEALLALAELMESISADTHRHRMRRPKKNGE